MEKKVLCVCFGNTCRSPMMEAILKALRDDITVESAGTHPRASESHPANEFSIAAMKARGIDISSHQSQWVGDLDLQRYDTFLFVGEKERDDTLEHSGIRSDAALIVLNKENDGVPNPYERGPEAYEKCADLLWKELRELAFAL